MVSLWCPCGVRGCPRGGCDGWWVSWCPRWHISAQQPSGRAARHLSAAGARLRGTKFSGLFSKGDCSKYQLFRFSYWGVPNGGDEYVKRLLSTIYRGKTIIKAIRYREIINANQYKHRQKSTILQQKQINILIIMQKYLYI